MKHTQLVLTPGAGSSTKERLFTALYWLFEAQPLVPAILVWIYALLWLGTTLLPPSPVDPWIAFAEIGWWSTPGYALIVVLLATYQLVCCSVFRCVWSIRLAAAALTSSFVVYTACAPMLLYLPSLPIYAPGNIVVAAASLLVVARCLRRPDQ